MPTVLITGASRGIGLEFARQYAADGWRVIATCRAPDKAPALSGLGSSVAVHPLDVKDYDAIHALAGALDGEAIDVLIANAGIFLDRDAMGTNVDTDAWLEMFAVNTIAPFICAGAFLDHVSRSVERKMIAISSGVASISLVNEGGRYAYRSSKAALNSAWRTFAHDHPEVIAMMLSPGRTRTDMNPGVWNAADVTVASLRRVIAGLTQEQSGGFFLFDGKPAQW
jgi:NAD(P)-dependent dehydrogenase (short-subunit alcohol dehydrogenase family)